MITTLIAAAVAAAQPVPAAAPSPFVRLSVDLMLGAVMGSGVGAPAITPSTSR